MTTITLTKKIEGRKHKGLLTLFDKQDKFVEVKYEVPVVTFKSLRNSKIISDLIEKAKISDSFTVDEYDQCCKWFCELFDNQFTPQEFINGYPASKAMPDIFAAYFAIQTGVIDEIKEFPLPLPTIPTTEN